MKTERNLTIVTLLLLALWVPVAVDKLYALDAFQAGIFRQPLPMWLRQQLVWGLPITESMIAVGLILNRKTRYWSFMISLFLMLAFTVYIGLALAGLWEQVPCVCGSVIRFLTWKQHFFFNLFYVFISGWGIHLLRSIQHPTSFGEAGRMGGPTRLATDK